MERKTEGEQEARILELEVRTLRPNDLQRELAAEKEKSAFLEKRVLELKQRVVDLVRYSTKSYNQSTQAEAEEEAITMQVLPIGYN